MKRTAPELPAAKAARYSAAAKRIAVDAALALADDDQKQAQEDLRAAARLFRQARQLLQVKP